MAASKGLIVGMCNPLLDISSEVPLTLLEKYDVKLNNAILAEPKHVPLYAELVKDFPVQYIAGGAGQNSIRVAQWMLQDKTGHTAYFGAVGVDEFGQKLGNKHFIYKVNIPIQTHTFLLLYRNLCCSRWCKSIISKK